MKYTVKKLGNSLVLVITTWCREHEVEQDDILIARLSKINGRKRK